MHLSADKLEESFVLTYREAIYAVEGEKRKRIIR